MCVKQKFSLTTQRYFSDLRKKPELQCNFHEKRLYISGTTGNTWSFQTFRNTNEPNHDINGHFIMLKTSGWFVIVLAFFSIWKLSKRTESRLNNKSPPILIQHLLSNFFEFLMPTHSKTQCNHFHDSKAKVQGKFIAMNNWWFALVDNWKEFWVTTTWRSPFQLEKTLKNPKTNSLCYMLFS